MEHHLGAGVEVGVFQGGGQVGSPGQGVDGHGGILAEAWWWVMVFLPVGAYGVVLAPLWGVGGGGGASGW